MNKRAIAAGWFGLVLSSLAVGGCYTLRPIARGTEPTTGEQIAVQVNDAGRVALGRSMGNEIDRIEGRLVAQDTTGFTIAVNHVYGLRGEVQVWSGEPVRIEDSYVRVLSERRLSRGRSLAMGAVGVGGFALLLSNGLLGSVFGNDSKVPSDSGVSLRVVWP